MAANQSQTSDLTKRQSEVLQVIRSHIEETGAPPTRAEIAKTLGFRSVNAAEDHLKALARKGAITLSPGTSRGIQLAGKYSLGIPIIKADAEGVLTDDKNIVGRMRLQAENFSQKPSFMVQNQGLALLHAGILDGDLLAVTQTDEPEQGKLMVCRVEKTLHVRRVLVHETTFELKAEHPDVPSITVNKTDLNYAFEGKVVGVIRTNTL